MNPIQKLNSSDQNIASTRTTVNTTVLALVVMFLNRYLDWDLTVEDLLPYMPVIVPVYFFFVRLSYFVAERYPKLARVLFGIVKKPVYEAAFPPPAPGTDVA